MKKYYLLRRNNATLLNDYLCDLPIKLRETCIKRTDFKHDLILIEKSCPKDFTESESVSNIWTVAEGCSILWQKFTKGRETYDYTGIVSPLIHLNGKVKLFNDHFYSKETEF